MTTLDYVDGDPVAEIEIHNGERLTSDLGYLDTGSDALMIKDLPSCLKRRGV